jgi:DNA-binding NarL/FixJ family response regulator
MDGHMKELTTREQEVCYLIAKGFSNREIGDKLFVTKKTIKFHLTNIYLALDLKSRAQLIVYMLEMIPTQDEVKGFINLMSPDNGR